MHRRNDQINSINSKKTTSLVKPTNLFLRRNYHNFFLFVYYRLRFHINELQICSALRELVPFVQFKKREKHPWKSVNFSKIAGWSWYQIAQRITNHEPNHVTQMSLSYLQNMSSYYPSGIYKLSIHFLVRYFFFFLKECLVHNTNVCKTFSALNLTIIFIKACNNSTTFSVSFLNEILFLLYFLLNAPSLTAF